MYDHIEGEITALTPNRAVLHASGVGYALKISLNTYSTITGKPKAILFTHLAVSETSMVLYGFDAEREREVFLLLIAVSGIGPNTALNILSYMTTEEVEHAAVLEDKAAFKRVKGIGDKGAAQIVLDLKGKFKIESGPGILVASSRGHALNDTAEEAIVGLTGLGFNKTEARKMADVAIASGETTLEGIIKAALKLSK